MGNRGARLAHRSQTADNEGVSQLAVAYVRVSTEEQAAFGGSLAMQTDRIAAYCALADLELVETISEEGVSGMKPLGDRPGGGQLLNRLVTSGARHVVALKLDRLFRNTADALNQVRAWKKAGVEMHLVDMGGMSLNTSSAMGTLLLTILAGLAEMERNLIAELTQAVLSHKRARRRVYSPIPLGFVRDGNRLAEDVSEQLVLARIRSMKARGDSLNAIARTLNADGVPTKQGKSWHASTIRYILGTMQHREQRAA
jgi:site-specific DNA recombinase